MTRSRRGGPMVGFVLLFIVLSALAKATDAVVIVGPDVAGPVSGNYGEWILWPAADRPDGANRILSILTGLDWEGTGADLVFGMHDGRYLSSAAKALRFDGYFIARNRVVQEPCAAIGSEDGFSSPIPLFLALDGRSLDIVPLSWDERWPSGVAFAAANSWNQVAAITAKAHGRVLVIEYPLSAGKRWSRYWLRGTGWGGRLPLWRDWQVPGLIPASQTGNLLIRPGQFKWVDNDSGNWGGADLWLSFIGYSAPLTFAVLGFLAAFFAGCTIYLISIEERPKFGGTALKYLILLPAAILVSGELSRHLGMALGGLWLVFGFLTLVCVSQILGGFFGSIFRGIHPMFSIALAGFAATAASNPLWSLYSNVLGQNSLPISPESAGAFLGYLVAICAFGRGNKVARWIGPVLAIGAFVWGIALNPWWVSGQWPFVALPAVALAAGEGFFKLWTLPFFAFLPLTDGRIWRFGFVWAPGNLFPNFQARESVNLARYAEFFASHGFVATLVIGVGIALFVERYFFHEVRRTLLRDSRVKSLFFACYVCLAMGLFQPLMLYAALMCFVGGTFVVLSDTAQVV